MCLAGIHVLDIAADDEASLALPVQPPLQARRMARRSAPYVLDAEAPIGYREHGSMGQDKLPPLWRDLDAVDQGGIHLPVVGDGEGSRLRGMPVLCGGGTVPDHGLPPRDGGNIDANIGLVGPAHENEEWGGTRKLALHFCVRSEHQNVRFSLCTRPHYSPPNHQITLVPEEVEPGRCILAIAPDDNDLGSERLRSGRIDVHRVGLDEGRGGCDGGHGAMVDNFELRVN